MRESEADLSVLENIETQYYSLIENNNCKKLVVLYAILENFSLFLMKFLRHTMNIQRSEKFHSLNAEKQGDKKRNFSRERGNVRRYTLHRATSNAGKSINTFFLYQNKFRTPARAVPRPLVQYLFLLITQYLVTLKTSL